MRVSQLQGEEAEWLPLDAELPLQSSLGAGMQKGSTGDPGGLRHETSHKACFRCLVP